MTVATSAADAMLQVDVQDTGEGFSGADIGRLFEPFYSTKGGQGSGLGLSIAYRIVNDHGGDIQALCKPGEGAHVRVRLPILAEAPEVIDEEEDVEAGFNS